MISTTNNASALRSIRAAFRPFRGLPQYPHAAWSAYQFDFEHGQWWVTCKPSGAIWSVVDSNHGVDFEMIEPGDED